MYESLIFFVMKIFIRQFIFISFLSFSFSSFAQSVGGTVSGATTFCSTTNSGFVTVSGYTGTILNWQSSTDGGITWTSIPNTLSTQTYFNLNQTTYFQAVVQNGSFPPDTSSSVCITVYPASVGGVLSGGGTFCAGSGPGIITLSAYTGNVLYWQYSINAGLSWTNISNTSDTESYSNITVNTLYRTIVRNGSSCPSDTSTDISFIINPPTVAGTLTGSGTVCETANSGMISLSGYTGNIIRWASSTDGGLTWMNIPNTGPIQSYVNLSVTTRYHAILQSGICSIDSTADATITVSPSTIAGTITGSSTFCGTFASGTLTLSGYNGVVQNWLYSNNSGLSWNADTTTGPVENYSGLASTTLFSAVIKSGACPADTATLAQIRVYPQTVAGTILNSASVCSSSNKDTLRLSGSVGKVLSWRSSTNNGLSWSTINDTSDFLFYTGLTETTIYEAIVKSGTCNTDTTASIGITVLLLPEAHAGNDTTISAGTQITLNGSGTGTPSWAGAQRLDNPAAFHPVTSPLTSTLYVLDVTDSNGCVNSDSVMISVKPSVFNGMVSNLFTPNGDGINDSWYIEGIREFPNNEVFVFSVYGNPVFNQRSYSNDWQGTYDGKELPDGTYYYIIRFEDNKVLKGSLDILRH